MFPHASRPRPAAPIRLLVALAACLAVALLVASRHAREPRHALRSLDGALLTLAGTVAAERRRPNHLIHEKSPYLLQHAYNPVDWYPWGDEAFAKARSEQKPIFLSIGYSTCHWCHVMERESFENDSVAALLNAEFVPVKVDREERPDVDRIYMAAMQAMGQGGGWPLNVFLTPDLEPFYGGTYFPPRSLPGRIGLTELLPRVHAAWVGQRDQLREHGSSVLSTLDSIATVPAGTWAADSVVRLEERCYDDLVRTEDRPLGGFGRAPKFPQASNLDFLFRLYARDPARNARALDMALRQLDAMQAGGIHDHLGGGFHRYSTDADWLVPHFEKMLYDQAQLAWAYLDAYQITGRETYAVAARGIFAYVARDLTSPEGAFYSAEDADSEGEEGKFYVWTPAEIAAVLPRDLADLVAFHYGVTPAGNFEHGTTILHAARSLDQTAKHAGLTLEQTAERLTRARAALLEARSQRVRPHRDDKVLAAWNGLMISAFARGARVLDDPELLRRAARAGDFAWSRLRDPRTGELNRRFRDGQVAGPGQLDDYANLALGYVDLYRAALDPVWLERAVALTEAGIERFWDAEHGGFFDSPSGDPHVRVRMKDGFDGAELSGNSVMAGNLVTLAALLDRRDWRDRAERTFQAFAGRLEPSPIAMPRMLGVMQSARTVPRHIVLAGAPEADETRAVRREFDRRYLPDDLLLLVDGGEAGRSLARLAPFTAPLAPKRGGVTVYVCINYACRLPVHDAAAFAAELDALTPARPTTGENR